MSDCEHGKPRFAFCEDCCRALSKKQKVYTCIKGEILVGELVNETRQGYRVKGGRVSYDHVVFKNKLRSGWFADEQKPFFTEKSFISLTDANVFAMKQILSMENYYKGKLDAINELKGYIAT